MTSHNVTESHSCGINASQLVCLVRSDFAQLLGCCWPAGSGMFELTNHSRLGSQEGGPYSDRS